MKGIPSREATQCLKKGRGRSRVIRELWAARCSFAEIQQALGVDASEISRTLRRPVVSRHVNRSAA